MSGRFAILHLLRFAIEPGAEGPSSAQPILPGAFLEQPVGQ